MRQRGAVGTGVVAHWPMGGGMRGAGGVPEGRLRTAVAGAARRAP
jgi:hypothetical protein